MAYAPPHKKQIKEKERPLPTPELLAPQFKKNLKYVKPSKYGFDPRFFFMHMQTMLHRDFIISTIGLNDPNQFPSTAR